MTLSELLTPAQIVLDFAATDKQQLFRLCAEKMTAAGKIAADRQAALIDLLNERERLSTTAVGEGVAIPHAQGDFIHAPCLLFVRSLQPMQWDEQDDEPVSLIFVIAVPEKSEDQHLEIITRLCRWLMDDNFRQALLDAPDAERVMQLLQQQEPPTDAPADKPAVTGNDHAQPAASAQFLVAVTACPTGIAHTFMAAENLEKAAVSMGYKIKVETNGAAGTGNGLTAQDIARAKAVIIAADTKVEMARFAGKPLHYGSVSQGIRDAQQMINQALEAAEYRPQTGSQPASGKTTPGVYGSLMNGVSNMLPFVIAGGILIALSFLWGINSADPQDASYSYLAQVIKQIGGAAFTLFIPVMSGYIAYAIGDRPGFAPGMVGGLLANTGGSGFLGAIVAGFIAGYLIKALRRLLSPLPASFEGLKPVLLYPLLSVFIVGFITVALINPFMGEVNNAVIHFLNDIGSTNKVLLGFIIGAMLAADLGGPINKAAYLFSVGVLASGNYYVMAAAVASGMVPSLAVALAANIAKNKFTASQCEAAKANYILGLSFIAEGAIPFAASNPLVILPSLMVGSGIAGSLAMLFSVTYPAPHGGVFVIPLVGHPLLFLLSTLVGVIISTALILLMKKNLSAEERLS
ncbi:hypothetical protein BTJ39_19485 [Izhakiella australiensis]|uniref:protein-N(pi)-phosphohistidine--D-fructose phosphotransferase n=1 Tax=Izhakiella australiensis TaxID=1926881 RepID=A0A1S8YGY1_9GAMM|nr:fructose-specific PTS transporter subunit EIIC [Izhakiella australiensis]OON37996.1 hypothetical protein BTJ39_19485 [Izhakiella australiensis]